MFLLLIQRCLKTNYKNKNPEKKMQFFKVKDNSKNVAIEVYIFFVFRNMINFFDFPLSNLFLDIVTSL